MTTIEPEFLPIEADRVGVGAVTREYAFEGAPVHAWMRDAEPDRLWASFPTFATLAEVEDRAESLHRRHPDGPRTRILTRVDRGPWEVVER